MTLLSLYGDSEIWKDAIALDVAPLGGP